MKGSAFTSCAVGEVPDTGVGAGGSGVPRDEGAGARDSGKGRRGREQKKTKTLFGKVAILSKFCG